MMHRIAHQNFCVLNQTSLPRENSSLITEISFQKNDDILVCLNKLLLQDQISSIYLKPQHELIQESNRLLSFECYLSTFQDHLSDQANLSKALNFWDNLIKKEEHLREQEEKEIIKASFSKKFIKVSSFLQNKEALVRFYKEVVKSDRVFMDGYIRDGENQTVLHTEEVNIACEKNMKQGEIEGLVNLHMKRLEELDVMYREEFLKKQEQKKIEFVNFIEKLYKDYSENSNKQSYVVNSGLIMSNISRKSDGFGSKNEDIGGELKRISNSLRENPKEKEIGESFKKKEKNYELKLCLGMQRKYEFKVKLREIDYRDYLTLKGEDLSKLINRSSNEIKNCAFGIEQKGLLNIISLKTDEAKSLEKFLKFKTDLFYEEFEEQVKEIKQKLQLQNNNNNNKFLQSDKNNAICFNNGDVLITKHGNLKSRLIFSVVYESLAEFQNDSFLSWFRKIVSICNENQIKSLCLPLQLFLGGAMNNYYSMKSYGDLLLKIIKMIKREINNFAMGYSINHFIKKINIIIPKGNENFPYLFERSKEILKNVFE